MRVWPSGRAVAFQATHTGSIPVTRSIAIFLLLALPAFPQQSQYIQRAVAYLSEHVPSWPKENNCFSCHNNADGYRALIEAKRKGYKVPDEALKDTQTWLANPAQWDQGAQNKMASDLKLARLQFALAANNREILLSLQSPNGSWQVDTGDLPGSPITWGTPLATALAYRATQNPKALNYLKILNVYRTVDLAARIWLFANPLDLTANQNPDGSWGPVARSPGEVFDTAIAVLALADRQVTAPLRAAKQYLESQQLSTGAWPETTRPSGGTSYAHHISTTAWATLALLRLEQPNR